MGSLSVSLVLLTTFKDGHIFVAASGSRGCLLLVVFNRLAGDVQDLLYDKVFLTVGALCRATVHCIGSKVCVHSCACTVHSCPCTVPISLKILCAELALN